MPDQLPSEREVLKALDALVASAEGNNNVKEQLSAFFAVTENLPVSKLAKWERKLRATVGYTPTLGTKIPTGQGSKLARPIIPWVDIFDANGYRREEALKKLLNGAPNPLLFALACRRLNDWVPQVRDQAAMALPRIASASEPSLIIDAIWTLIPFLSSWGRAHQIQKQVLINMLTVRELYEPLRSKIIETSAGPAASVLANVSRVDALDKFLPQIAREAIQPAVRATAFRILLMKKAVWSEGRKWTWIDRQYCVGRFEPILATRNIEHALDYTSLLDEAVKDRSVIVRRVAGKVCIKKRGELEQDAIRIAHILKGDDDKTVAELGRWLIENVERSDGKSNPT